MIRVNVLRLAGSFGIGIEFAQAMGWLVATGDWRLVIGDWLELTRTRRLISPTAGGFALWFFALIVHVWGHDARNMARCGGRGGRGDYTD